MPYLVIKSNGKTHRVELNSEVTIGRANTCTLRFPDDKTMSREHCKIRQLDNGQWMLVDMTSRNGTRIHDERIEWHILRENDEFSVGDVMMTFRAGPLVSRPSHPDEAMVQALTGPSAPVAPKQQPSSDDANDLHATRVTVYNKTLMPGKVSFAPTEGEPVVKPYALPFQRPRPQPKIK